MNMNKNMNTNTNTNMNAILKKQKHEHSTNLNICTNMSMNMDMNLDMSMNMNRDMGMDNNINWRGTPWGIYTTKGRDFPGLSGTQEAPTPPPCSAPASQNTAGGRVWVGRGSAVGVSGS